jgi:hypothetical protein
VRDNLAHQGFEKFQSSCSTACTGSYHPSSRHDMVAHDRVGTLAAKKRCYGAGVGAYLQLELVALAGRTEFGVEQNPPVKILPCQRYRRSFTKIPRHTKTSYLAVYGHYIIVYRVQTLRLHPCRRLGNGRIEKRQTLMGL